MYLHVSSIYWFMYLKYCSQVFSLTFFSFRQYSKRKYAQLGSCMVEYISLDECDPNKKKWLEKRHWKEKPLQRRQTKNNLFRVKGQKEDLFPSPPVWYSYYFVCVFILFVWNFHLSRAFWFVRYKLNKQKTKNEWIDKRKMFAWEKKITWSSSKKE